MAGANLTGSTLLAFEARAGLVGLRAWPYRLLGMARAVFDSCLSLVSFPSGLLGSIGGMTLAISFFWVWTKSTNKLFDVEI